MRARWVKVDGAAEDGVWTGWDGALSVAVVLDGPAVVYACPSLSFGIRECSSGLGCSGYSECRGCRTLCTDHRGMP